MKTIRFLVICVAAMAATGAGAEVTECTLMPDANTGFTEGMLRTYQHNGTHHSTFLQVKTDYGDTLPYLFNCDDACSMRMVGDEYEYSLLPTPSMAEPRSVVLLALSADRKHVSSDHFAVSECRTFD